MPSAAFLLSLKAPLWISILLNYLRSHQPTHESDSLFSAVLITSFFMSQHINTLMGEQVNKTVIMIYRVASDLNKLCKHLINNPQGF